MPDFKSSFPTFTKAAARMGLVAHSGASASDPGTKVAIHDPRGEPVVGLPHPVVPSDGGDAPGEKSSRATRAILAYLGPVAPVWMNQNYEGYAREGYALNVYVFRAVQLLADAMSDLPLDLFGVTRGGKLSKVEDHNHPLHALMECPNPDVQFEGASAFFARHFSFYALSGNAYMEKVGPNDGPPKELYSHRPDRMRILPGTRSQPVAGYQYTVRGGSTAGSTGYEPLFPTEKIMHNKSFHPWDDWYGMSPLSPGARSVDGSNSAKAWNVSLLQNAGRPSGIYTIKDGTFLTEEEAQNVRRLISERYNGPRNAGRDLLLEADISYTQTSLSPAEMDWIEGQRLSRDEIALVYGIPPELLTAQAGTEPRNESAYKFLYVQTILPLMRRFLGGFNRFVTTEFGDDLRLMVDLNRVHALQEERETLWGYITAATFLTENEKRVATGHDPAPWGDVRVFPSSMVEVDEQGNARALLPLGGSNIGNTSTTSGSGGAAMNGGGRPKKPAKKDAEDDPFAGVETVMEKIYAQLIDDNEPIPNGNGHKSP